MADRNRTGPGDRRGHDGAVASETQAADFLQAMEAIEFQLERCAEALLLQTLLRYAADLFDANLISGDDYDATLAELVRRQLEPLVEHIEEEARS